MAHGIKANAIPIIQRELPTVDVRFTDSKWARTCLPEHFPATTYNIRCKKRGRSTSMPSKQHSNLPMGLGFRQGMVIYGGEAVA